MTTSRPRRAAGAGPVATGRGVRRRESIVAAAAELFARSGYPAVGMDDIGAAAGVTGPAIYRYFPSKAAVLAAVFDRIIDAVEPPTSTDADPAGAADVRLSAHIDHYSAAVASRRELMAVFVREVHHLPVQHGTGLRDRQRALVNTWRELVARVHPDWSAERVRTSVHAVFGMLNAVGTFVSPLSDGELAAQLAHLAGRALSLPEPR